MKTMLALPLLLLAFSAVLSQVMANDDSIYTYDAETASYTYNPYNQTIDGTPTTFEIEGFSLDPAFDLQTGVIALIIIMIAVGLVAGIQVLGSGLSDHSVKIIYTSLFFYTLWALLSVFGLPSITAIPVIGWVFYFFLTLAYSVGVVGQINGT